MDGTDADPPRTCLPVPDRLAPAIASGPLSCAQADAANIAGAHTGNGSSTWATDAGRTKAGRIGVMATGRRVRRPNREHPISCWTPVVCWPRAHLNHDPSDSALSAGSGFCQRLATSFTMVPEHRRRCWMNRTLPACARRSVLRLHIRCGGGLITPDTISMQPLMTADRYTRTSGSSEWKRCAGCVRAKGRQKRPGKLFRRGCPKGVTWYPAGRAMANAKTG